MDIYIAWDPAAARGDWDVTSGDLVVDPGGLQTAVLLSLFTDRVAPPDYVPPVGSPAGRRGHWSDTYEPFPIGSWLWLLNRTPISDGAAVLLKGKDYCLLALQWLVDEGVVASAQVTTWWMQPGVMGIRIVIAKPQQPPETFDFSWAWQGIPMTPTQPPGSAIGQFAIGESSIG